MTVSGSLSDLKMMDLILFPLNAGKSGELIVAGLDTEARLYYDNGQLRHAASDDCIGIDAIARLLSFSEGEFEFRVDVGASENTIDIPLREIISRVTDTRGDANNGGDTHNGAAGKFNMLLQDTISDAARKHDYVEHVALFKTDAALICKWDRDEADELFEASIHQVITLIKKHPREGLNRIYLSDAAGTIVATLINPTTILLMNASSQSTLGMISLASTKMSQLIQNVV